MLLFLPFFCSQHDKTASFSRRCFVFVIVILFFYIQSHFFGIVLNILCNASCLVSFCGFDKCLYIYICIHICIYLFIRCLYPKWLTRSGRTQSKHEQSHFYRTSQSSKTCLLLYFCIGIKSLMYTASQMCFKLLQLLMSLQFTRYYCHRPNELIYIDL